MAANSRVRLYVTTFLTGVISIASYILLYTHQEWVTRHFTRGGVYAVLPIATAFYFSFVYGTFTSCLLHVAGLRESGSTGSGNRQPAGASPDKEPT